MKRRKTIATTIIVLLAVWFLGVDWSWFVHECPDCGFVKDVTQYRVFTISIHETTFEYPSIEQKIAVDLGAPCTHANSSSWHKHRLWGLYYCKAPCINGIYRLTGDDSWYDSAASAKVAALAESDPSLASQFAQRVFQKHQFDFVRMVLDRAGIDPKAGKEQVTR